MSSESNYGLLYPRPLDFPTFEFRLLRLLPAGEDEADDGIIRCSLGYEFLIERYDDPTGITFPVPDYVALSYCWGDPAITRLISVNDLPVQVTTNLEAALRALRNRKVKTVWIDALCINQLDLLERGLQVMRMGLIYSNASYVMAWVGKEADDSNYAINCLAHRAQMLQDRKLPRGIGHNKSGSGSEKSSPLKIQSQICSDDLTGNVSGSFKKSRKARSLRSLWPPKHKMEFLTGCDTRLGVPQ